MEETMIENIYSLKYTKNKNQQATSGKWEKKNFHQLFLLTNINCGNPSRKKFFCFLLLFSIIILLVGGTVEYLNSPTQLLSFIPSPMIPGTVSTGNIFEFTYMCIHYF
jgi:hypothetical protein